MKTLLAILLSFIVSEAPVLAIHGGYTLGGTESVTGTYAGVLIPTSSETLTTGTNQTNFGSNSLGLFTLSVPDAGVGSGSVVIFSGADQATGSVQALPDPATPGNIIGILTATAYATVLNYIDVAGNYATEQVIVATANGALETSVGASSVSNSPTGVNLSGTADVTFATESNNDFFFFGSNLQPSENVTYAVEGFQQSSSAAESSGTF